MNMMLILMSINLSRIIVDPPYFFYLLNYLDLVPPAPVDHRTEFSLFRSVSGGCSSTSPSQSHLRQILAERRPSRYY